MYGSNVHTYVNILFVNNEFINQLKLLYNSVKILVYNIPISQIYTISTKSSRRYMFYDITWYRIPFIDTYSFFSLENISLPTFIKPWRECFRISRKSLMSLFPLRISMAWSICLNVFMLPWTLIKLSVITKKYK